MYVSGARAVTPGVGRPAGGTRPAGGAWWMSAVAAAVLLGIAAIRMDTLSWGAVGIMSALGLATGVFAFRVDERTYASFATAVFVASVALFGAFVGVWVVAATTAMLETVVYRRGLRRAVENVGIEGVAIFIAAIVYAALGGRLAPSAIGLTDIGAYFVLFGTFGGMVAVLTSLTGESAGAAFGRYVRWVTGKGVVIELAMLPLGLLLVASYSPGEPATFPLLAVVLMISGAAGKALWDTQQSLVARVDELRSLNALGSELSSTLRVDVLVELLHERVSGPLGASVVCVALYDEGEGTVDYRASFGVEGEVVSWRGELDASLTSWIVRHRTPLLGGSEDDGERPRCPSARLVAEAQKRGIVPRAWIGVPLVAGQRFVGVMSLLSGTGGAFGENQLEMVRNIGAQIARAIENAVLYEGLERSREAIEQWNHTLEERVQERTRELERTHAELEALNGDLERRVEERTRELRDVQEKIVQSGRLAAVGELAAGLAHELNNPLAGILGYTQIDLERIAASERTGLAPAETRRMADHLAQIETETLRCKGIVENLLKFSQASQASFTEIDVNDVLRQTLEFTEKQLTMRGIALDVELEPSAPPVVGHPQELKQVFANIILNARNAMASGGRLSVRTRAAKAPDGSPEVAIDFADNGSGISQEYLGRVFEPFFTTRDVGQGAGLGLSVSYGIVKDHGGEIDVRSEVGVGSTFTVHLPCTEGGTTSASEAGGMETTC
jgi:signal transduction histidine kinase